MSRELFRQALIAIRDYEPEYTHPTEQDLADVEACPACQDCRRREWPPSSLCDKHYRLITSYADRNKRTEAQQHFKLRRIASEALKSGNNSDD